MTDAEIIEAMARAGLTGTAYDYVTPVEQERMLELAIDAMTKAFAICAPAIRAQAMEEAAVKAWTIGMEAHMRQPWATDSREVGSRIAENLRALAPPAVAEKGSK